MVKCHICGENEATYFLNKVAYCEDCRPVTENGKVIRHISGPPRIK